MSASILVLHVEDDPEFAAVTTEFLERESENLTVVTEGSVADGIDRLRTDEIDCVLSDYDLPAADGVTFLERVRALDDRLPFVLCTGKGSEEVASEAISKGATDYLQKERGTDQYAVLANRIENAVERYRTVAELERQNDLFEQAQDIADIGAWEYDVQAGEAWLSERGYRIHGLDPAHDPVPSLADELYRPEDAAALEEAFERAIEAGESYDLECRFTTDEGGTRWVRIRGEPRVEDGDVVAVRATIDHVTERKRRERELVYHERLVEETTDLITVVDESGRITYQSPSVEETLGVDREAAIGEDPFPFIHPEDRDEARSTFEDLVADPGASSERVEYRMQRADGDWIWLESRASNRTETALDGIVIASRDVSRRKETEQEQVSYRTIVEAMGDTVYALDEDSNYLHVNAAGTDLSGYDPEALMEAGPGLVYSEEAIETFESAIRELLSEDDRRAKTVEASLTTADGESIPIEGTLTLLPRENGEFRGTVGVIRDISERKDRERELERYETILRAIPDEVSILDTDGRFVDVIPPAGGEKLQSGHRPEELEGEHASRVMTDEDMERGEKYIEELVTTDRERASYEMDIVTRDGTHLPRETHIALLTDDDGSILGTVSVLRDVSERKQYERELERQNDRLERFAEITSHDLRNPLNVAQGRLSLAREDVDDENLAAAADALDRMRRLIEDMLGMARRDVTTTDVERIDVTSLVPACWEAIDAQAATLEIDDPGTVHGDRDHLRQILENLLRNAVEHGSTSPASHAREEASDRADPGITVRVGRVEGGGIYVEDDGSGIPPEDREGIFEIGYTTAADGTGFGLAIAKDLVDALGGEIAVTESESGGARFELTGLGSDEADGKK